MRHLALEGAASTPMIAAQVEQALVGGHADPEVKRHGAAQEVIVETAQHLHPHFLDDVGGVQSLPQASIEVIIDEGTQSRPDVGQQLVQRLSVAVADLIEQSARLRGIWVQSVHRFISVNKPTLTEKM